jgi:LmbE family N-acetylglucosaminyl deacetylase
MPDETNRLLILGAHPDDAEFACGGLASIYRKMGHAVKMISVTNGQSGHHEKSGQELVDIRRAEAAASGKVIDAPYEVWDFPDGYLQPTIEVRERIIKEIRTFKPDLVLTHRPNDYHPDHRAVGQAVQDASYMVTVPPVVPEVPFLRTDPIVGYLPDLFTKPTPLQPDVIVDITDAIGTITQMLGCHTSQVFEWLPFNEGKLDKVPKSDDDRSLWLRGWVQSNLELRTERFRSAIEAAYGQQDALGIAFIEVFEISEYAGNMDGAARRRLFPFVPH